MKKLPGLLLALSLPLTLSGCQTPQADTTTDQPTLLYYEQDYDSIDDYRGVINTNGELILPIDSTDKSIIEDADGDPAYLMTRQTFYDYTQQDEWGYPLVTGAEFRFYDTDGELLQTVDMRGKGDVTCRTAPNMQDTLFFCDMTDTGGDLTVINMDGTAILTREFDLPADQQVETHYVNSIVADDWFALEYGFYGYYNDLYNSYQLLDDGADFYTTDGQPMTMPQAYRRVRPLYDNDDYNATGFFQTEYHVGDATRQDILDGQGNVVLAGFSDISRYHDGVLLCERDGESGLMDMQGNWLYCDSTGQTTGQIPPNPADTPYMMHYYNGNTTAIINTHGTMVIPPDNVTRKSIYYNADGEQAYAMTTQTIYDYTRQDYWGHPLVSGAEFRFYDPYGELLQTVDMRGKGQVRFYEGATLQEGVFLCDMADINNTLAVLRMDGTPIFTIDLGIPEGQVINSRNIWLNLAGEWLYLSYGYNKDYEDLADGQYICTLTGEPLTLAQDYDVIHPLYDMDGSGRSNAEYFRAHYINSQGISLVDILDRQGSVILAGLSTLGTYYDGRLICERGSERGLIDMQGNWLYRESIFNALDD